MNYAYFKHRKEALQLKNTIQSLREYQNQVDLSKLEKSIYISIDRLTVIFDSENQSLRRIFRELRK